MLNFKNTLIFPTLRFSHEVKFSNKKNPVPIFMLDWTFKEGKFNEIRKDGYVDPLGKFISALPKEYEDWIRTLEFNLPKSYQLEIQRCAREAYMRWSDTYPFDTMIREICLKPTITYVWVICNLLSDCIFDQDTHYFSRSPDKFIVPYALAYKFWRNQTGIGLVCDHAGIPELRNKLYYIDDDHKRKSINDFLDAIDKHEKVIQMNHHNDVIDEHEK